MGRYNENDPEKGEIHDTAVKEDNVKTKPLQR